MLFDWFTFFAQLFNFLLLIWLLKRFLYKPILKTIEEREKHIIIQLQDAEAKKDKAIEELEGFQRKNNEYELQRQTLLNNAINEANEEHQRLLEESRKEIEILRLRLHETLKAEQQNLSSEIMRRTRSEVFAIARKTLNDLATSTLEEQMTNVFINRIKEQISDEKNQLISAIKSASNQIVVRSTFELQKHQHTAIENAIKSKLVIDPKIEFEIADHLVSGIELVAGGYKVVWSIEDYLVSLEASISDVLNEKNNYEMLMTQNHQKP